MTAGTALDTAPAAPAGRHRVRRTVLGAAVGSFVEYYDFAVFAALAPTLAKVFFPGDDPVAALLSTFAVFAVAFVARPLGGVVWGRFGDRWGRRRTLTALLTCMAAATVGIGLLPGYAALGLAAPVLLTLLRLAQGFSAGGEIMGAAVLVAEHAPADRRGRLTSVLQVTTTVAVLVGLGVAGLVEALVPPDDLVAWGWRVPFLLAGPLGLVGLYLRRRVEEPRMFTADPSPTRRPLRDALAPGRRRAVVLAGGVGVLQFVAFYLLLTYMPTYLVEEVGLPRPAALLSVFGASAVLVVAIPLMGVLSDRVGRRPVLGVASAVVALGAYPAFLLLAHGGFVGAVVGQVLLALPAAATAAVMLAAQVELFPTRCRYTGYALGMNVANAVFGGGAPLAATAVVAATGDLASPGWLLVVAAVVSLAVVAAMRETAHDPLPA